MQNDIYREIIYAIPSYVSSILFTMNQLGQDVITAVTSPE